MYKGYKCLTQGSVLSQFMYNFYPRLVKACLHPLCSILQYADGLVVLISEEHVEAVRDCLQTSLTRLMTWFGDLGPGSWDLGFIPCKQVKNYGFLQ
jgi:hypothetical protein